MLLDDGTGQVRPQLAPLLEALASQEHPRSARIWLITNPETTNLLRDLARGVLPLNHATFEQHPKPTRVRFLRHLCTELNLLPAYNRDIDAYETWLAAKLTEAKTIEHRQLIEQYANWVHLNRMRHLASKGMLRPAAILAARQSTNVALAFLTFLDEHGHSPALCSQKDIDNWLTGPTTRSLARGFVRWAIKSHHIPYVDFPYRVAATSPIIGQPERLGWLREALEHDGKLSPAARTAVVLLLLYGQPLTRVAEITTEQVLTSSDGQVSLLIGDEPAPVPAPFDQVITEYLQARPNMNTSANKQSKWLFPGASPGRHATAQWLMKLLRGSGIDLLGARNATLRRLVLEMPAPLVADALGYSYQVIDHHALNAGKKWAAYAGFGTKGAPSLNSPDTKANSALKPSY